MSEEKSMQLAFIGSLKHLELTHRGDIAFFIAPSLTSLSDVQQIRELNIYKILDDGIHENDRVGT